MDYAAVRCLHISCALVSVALFMVRGWLQWKGVSWRRWWWLRVLPHLNDSVLLAAAVTLAWRSNQLPWNQPWLAAKVVALVAYVLAGRLALRSGAQPGLRVGWFWLAVSLVLYILMAAHWRSVFPLLK